MIKSLFDSRNAANVIKYPIITDKATRLLENNQYSFIVDPKSDKPNLNNNVIMSYRNAVRLMTDELVIDHNVLVVPGIRDSLITDFAARRVRDYGKAI